MNNRKLSSNDLYTFADLLRYWSMYESSRSLRQFMHSFGMTESQFYFRISQVQKKIIGFDINEIKNNLRANRITSNLNIRDQDSEKKITYNFQKAKKYT